MKKILEKIQDGVGLKRSYVSSVMAWVMAWVMVSLVACTEEWKDTAKNPGATKPAPIEIKIPTPQDDKPETTTTFNAPAPVLSVPGDKKPDPFVENTVVKKSDLTPVVSVPSDKDNKDLFDWELDAIVNEQVQKGNEAMKKGDEAMKKGDEAMKKAQEAERAAKQLIGEE
jgi:hypothetical protein